MPDSSLYGPTKRATLSEIRVSDGFKAKLAKLAGAGMRPEPSAVRIRVQETFDEIAAAKGRNVTWQQIADLLNEEGLRTTDGSLLTANQVSAAYSSEKAARGERRRRPKKQLVQTTAPAVQPPPLTGLAEPGDEPKPTRRGFQFTKSRPKIHRKE
jgi:hypothetical protein